MQRERRLGEFLRARRHLTAPEQVGLPGLHDRRRTPGLRREEVAMLAGVSTDYYVRLEQGRERNPSDQVLDALARVFQLDVEAAEYLHELARPRGRRRPHTPTSRVDRNVVLLMEGWDRVAAYVVNQRLDVLVRNMVAAALYDGLEHSDNLLRLALLNPHAREFYLDWEKDTRQKVAHLRAAAGVCQDDPSLGELIEELTGASEEFRRLWGRHDVRGRIRAPVRFHHEVVGDVITTMEVMTIDSSPGQKLITFQAEPGSPSERALGRLGAMRRRGRTVARDAARPLPSYGG
ncbi:helix-turn-helix domain-containing protein [Sphaerisporangium aureirubrum]|uniref:Helix-turn-helix domain-containing protein n=1 Tax=Sphaerisporangium aureirubrum TaxID=1544736 RepID=A0ABW1NMF4_9ACTN